MRGDAFRLQRGKDDARFAAPNALPDRRARLVAPPWLRPEAIDKMGLNSLLLRLSMRITHEIREMEKAREQISALNGTP